MPRHTNAATVSGRPEQPLGTMRLQTGPGPGPAGDPGPQPQTTPDASTRGHRPAAQTQANPEPHPHHNPPVRPTAGPTHTPSDGPPTQTRTATPADATSARPELPLGTMHPRAHIPTGSPSPQVPATPYTSTPWYHPSAPAEAEPAPQQRHDPPARPPVRPTEAPSGSHPAPSPDPDPDPRHGTVPADAPRANAPGHELPTGIPHPEGGTLAARPAAAEGNGGTRAPAGHEGGQAGPAPVPDAQTRAATPIKDDAATPPAPPAQPQRQEPTVDATEEAGGPPQREVAPLPAADLTARGPPIAETPSGVTGQPNKQHASTPANPPPDVTARESSEAPDAGQPGTGPGGPTPNAEHSAPPPPTNRPRATNRGSRGRCPIHGPSTPQQRRRTGGRHDPGGADTGPTSSPGGVRSPGNHTRHAQARRRLFRRLHGVLQECSPHRPNARRPAQPPGATRQPYRGHTPHDRQAHLQRDYAALGARTEHTAATDDGRATTSGAADQTPDEPPRHSAQSSGTRVETGTNTVSGPADQPPGTTSS